jgi:hypothetical protein
MQVIDCFRLEGKRDGSGSDVIIARFKDNTEASKVTSKMKYTGLRVKKEQIIIYDTAVEFAPELDTNARKSGLAKLTKQEKIALGLKDA